MQVLTKIYNELYDAGVIMFQKSLPFADAAVIECEGAYGLFVDVAKFDTLASETVAVAHEAGHIMTGATHTLSSPYDLIGQHEYRANKWAIKRLVPKEALESAVSDGYTEAWELADMFNVTEDFIRKAAELYSQK